MKNLLAFLSVWFALPLAAQTVNPNQIRPATVDGQVLTTPIANQAPSWQTPASGVSVATTPPCTVNGGTGPVSSGTATITCANGTQTYYKQQGTGTYYQLIRPTACVAVHSSGWSATCAGNNAGGITTNGTGSASLTYSFTGITPPAGATLVGAYVYGISSATGNTNAGEGFVTVGVGTNCTSGNLIPASRGVNFAWPSGQGGCQLSTTSGLDTVQIEMNMIVSLENVGGAASIDDVGIEVDYNVGPTPPASASLLIAPPLSLNNNVLGMGPIWPTATYPTTVARLSQYAYTLAGTIVPVTDAVNSTDCATGGGSTLVDCISDGDGGWTARSFTGGITALTGDVSATGPGSAAATVLKVNNGTIPTSQTCVGTNSSGQFIDGSCGGGGGLNGTVTYTSSQTASSSDNGKLVIMNCSGACAYTLPATQPSTTWQIALQSVGSTTATVALSGDTYNGGASAPVLPNYYTLPIWANTATSTDYRGGTPPVASTNVTITPAANGQAYSATGGSTTVSTFSCSDTSGSGTAQSCTAVPTLSSLTVNTCIAYTTTTSNTGGLTLNVSSLGAKSVVKWQGTALVSGDLGVNKSTQLCYDGTNWDAQDIGNAPSGGGGSPVPPSGFLFAAAGTSSEQFKVAIGQTEIIHSVDTGTFTSSLGNTINTLVNSGGQVLLWINVTNAGTETITNPGGDGTVVTVWSGLNATNPIDTYSTPGSRTTLFSPGGMTGSLTTTVNATNEPVEYASLTYGLSGCTFTNPTGYASLASSQGDPPWQVSGYTTSVTGTSIAGISTMSAGCNNSSISVLSTIVALAH